MNKASVERALEKGSPKQKALLIANHLAEKNTGGSGFLSDKELLALSASFQTEKELTLYNNYKKMFERVQIYLSYLSQFRLSYMEVLARLDNFVLLRKANSDMEELANKLLELLPDKKARAKAFDIITEYSNPALMRSFSKDKEGYVEVEDQETLLDEFILDLQATVKEEQVKLKTAIAVIKDYLDATGFNVRIFWGFIKEVENWAKSKKGKDRTLLLSERAMKQLSNPLLLALFEKHSLEPDYSSVEVDPEQYEQFKQSYLYV